MVEERKSGSRFSTSGDYSPSFLIKSRPNCCPRQGPGCHDNGCRLPWAVGRAVTSRTVGKRGAGTSCFPPPLAIPRGSLLSLPLLYPCSLLPLQILEPVTGLHLLTPTPFFRPVEHHVLGMSRENLQKVPRACAATLISQALVGTSICKTRTFTFLILPPGVQSPTSPPSLHQYSFLCPPPHFPFWCSPPPQQQPPSPSQHPPTPVFLHLCCTTW